MEDFSFPLLELYSTILVLKVSSRSTWSSEIIKSWSSEKSEDCWPPFAFGLDPKEFGLIGKWVLSYFICIFGPSTTIWCISWAGKYVVSCEDLKGKSVFEKHNITNYDNFISSKTPLTIFIMVGSIAKYYTPCWWGTDFWFPIWLGYVSNSLASENLDVE